MILHPLGFLCMYKVHQNATLLPISFTSNKYKQGNREIDAVSVSASKDENGKSILHWLMPI